MKKGWKPKNPKHFSSIVRFPNYHFHIAKRTLDMNGYKTRALYCSVKRVKYFSRIMLLSQAQMVLNSKYHVWGIKRNQQHLDG